MAKGGKRDSTGRNLLSAQQLTELLEKARELTRQTRELVDQALVKGFGHRLKDDSSIVTEVDLAIEERMRSTLKSWFPSHGVVGEELPTYKQGADFQWIIDPIDGTHSLRHRIPLFGTLLALSYLGNLVLGVIDLPGLKRCYSGGVGLGAWCDGRRLHIGDLGSDEPLEHEILSIGERSQFLKAGKAKMLDRLYESHPSVRSYCDCFGHCLAIEGSVGAMIDPDLRIWDVAATAVLAKEAGCKFSWLRRDDQSRKGGSYDVVFGKPRVVDWVTQLWEQESSG